MHILVIPSWYPTAGHPFNGSFFREQALMLSRAGHDVTVMSPRLLPAPQWRGHLASTEIDSSLRVVRLDLPATPRLLQGGEDRLFGRIAVRALVAAEVEIPDVIHAHSVMPASILAKEIGLRWDRPYVITEHRPSSLRGTLSGPRRRHVRQAVKDAAAVATVSRPFSDALESHYARSDVGVVDLPVPDGFLAARSTLDSESPYTFLHVSHLDRNKRAAETIEAFSRIRRGEARLIVAGGTEDRVAALQDLAARLGVEGRVEFLGRVERDLMPQVMAGAHCLVLASAVEAGGTVIGEARAAGMAVIATETWAGRHGVDVDAGALVPVDDFERLGEALTLAADQRWAADARQRERIRAAAHDRFSSGEFVARQVEMYEHAREVGARPRIIFHAPYPIDPHPTSASRLRPLKMREAFRELGFQVHEITGNPRDRVTGYRDARRRRRAGQHLALLYSENSTQPNLFSTSIRTGLAPFVEGRMFAWAQRSKIPAGEFYRDIYWKFSTRLGTVRSARSLAMLLSYRVDLAVLRVTGVHLFLPSEAMGAELPMPRDRYSALPPGTVVRESAAPGNLHLFYVGGLGDDYGLHACVEAVAAIPQVTLTMCVPRQAWERFGSDYAAHLSDRIRVVHAGSHELAPYYAEASACVLFVEPTPYRRFAAPVKFFEYLGYGKPILLSEGTMAGQLGAQMGIGLEIPYSVDAFSSALQELVDEPQRVERMAARAREVRHDHTWAKRATVAVAILAPDLVPVVRTGRQDPSPQPGAAV